MLSAPGETTPARGQTITRTRQTWAEFLSLAALMLATLGWLGVTMIFLAEPTAPRLAAIKSTAPSVESLLGHLLLFFGLGVLAALSGVAATASRQWRRLLGYATLSGLLWGAFTEWYQIGVPGRSGNLSDVFTDTLGAALGGLAAWALLRLFSRVA